MFFLFEGRKKVIWFCVGKALYPQAMSYSALAFGLRLELGDKASIDVTHRKRLFADLRQNAFTAIVFLKSFIRCNRVAFSLWLCSPVFSRCRNTFCFQFHAWLAQSFAPLSSNNHMIKILFFLSRKCKCMKLSVGYMIRKLRHCVRIAPPRRCRERNIDCMRLYKEHGGVQSSLSVC